MLDKLRKFENFHIVLWLIKDSCWVLKWPVLGSIMAFPAIVLAIFLTVICKKQPALFYPNMAVTFWITANSIWMFSEFYNLNLETAAIVFFGFGLLSIGWYYIKYRQADVHV